MAKPKSKPALTESYQIDEALKYIADLVTDIKSTAAHLDSALKESKKLLGEVRAWQDTAVKRFQEEAKAEMIHMQALASRFESEIVRLSNTSLKNTDELSKAKEIIGGMIIKGMVSNNLAWRNQPPENPGIRA